MYIHHQPKHWNTNRWGEHWSRCYNQMFCWKLWVLAFMWTPLWRVSSTQTWLQTKYPPSWQQHSLMAVPPPAGQCTCNTAETAQEWSDEPELAFEFLRSQTKWESVGCARTKWSWYIQWTLSWIEIWGIQSPGWHFEVFVMFFRSFLSSFCSDAATLSCWGGTAIEQCHCHERLYFVCSCVWVSGASQSGVLMNAGTPGFPAERAIVTRSSMLLFHLSLVLILWWMVLCKHATNKNLYEQTH